jgi:hypothetical protein
VFLFPQPDEKKKMLRKFPYFKLEVMVYGGKELLAMDRGGKKTQKKISLKLLLGSVAGPVIQVTWRSEF